MPKLDPQIKIAIFKNLFRGREDVFAVRWEKADKSVSGYTPFCLNEWKSGICIKLRRGKCRDCQYQNYPKLNDFYIKQHLMGRKTFGIYPLLEDNTSYFLAADFDGRNWQKAALDFFKKCKSFNFPAYIERSRSGSGGHVWLFFAENYPAYKSRRIAFEILKGAKIIDQFSKEDSFDRLFPNQDHLSGKGFGNLIALPLQGVARKNNNTVFLDPTNKLAPYQDQWEFLKESEKISIDKLDQVYDAVCEKSHIITSESKTKITLVLKEQIYMSKNNLPKVLIDFLKENLNFYNSEYFVKKKMGLSVHGIEKYFKLIDTTRENITIPRGFINDFIDFLNENNIKYDLIDKRSKKEPIKLKTELSVHEYQQVAINRMVESENGLLVAPPGSGKTIIGIELIYRLKQPTLILVHRKQIFNQWIERIEHFLNIPKREIGQFGSSKKKIGNKVTVAMIQTLNKMADIQAISEKFGMIIVDECHHIPAKMFRNVITKFNPFYLYGLTATPERKYNDEKLIYIYLGEILHKIDKDFIKQVKTEGLSEKKAQRSPKIKIRKTDLSVPFKVETDNFTILSKILIFDSNRNNQIVADIKDEATRGSKCLILTERKEHVEVLSYYLKREYEIIILTGGLTENQKKARIKQIESGHFRILLATGQLIGEGTDFPNLDCLFLVFPFAFSGKLTQYIGRIQRGTNENTVIYDYRDNQLGYLDKLYKQRFRYYKKHFGIACIEEM